MAMAFVQTVECEHNLIIIQRQNVSLCEKQNPLDSQIREHAKRRTQSIGYNFVHIYSQNNQIAMELKKNLT